MTTAGIALLISGVSVCIALFTLGWNIYRDIILKPGVKVRLQISEIISYGEPPGTERPTKIDITATNFGPGYIRLQGLRTKYSKLFRKKKLGFICPDFTDPMSHKFPCKLDVGEKTTFFLPYEKNCFLSDKVPFTHLGIFDTFGRSHWVPKDDIERTKKEYKAKFGSEAPNL